MGYFVSNEKFDQIISKMGRNIEYMLLKDLKVKEDILTQM